jgi:LPXTG-site transpeptidase (sortase) family protein
MTVITVEADDELARLEVSRTRLETAAPDLSAQRLMRRRQWLVLAVIGAVVLICLILAPLATAIVFVGLCTVVYLATVVHRVVIMMLSVRGESILMVSDEDARAVPDEDLPIYTVLVPAFREPEVIATLLTHLGALEYPADKLDLKLMLEADDTDTVERALAHPYSDEIDIVLVPPGEPRTKPKALNYGLTLARGEYVTIYDAEDEPDPLQLRRAVVAFDRSPDDVACLQAQLTYRNVNQNIITRWFTIEYLMWFTLFLPGLSITNAPIPLGGTSNHIRRSVIEGLGGWDPFNVTEDADLGVRLHRVGWRCAVLGSVTYEEANSDFVNWMKQRSRWYKGYLQTWLVHLRHPVRLARELGAGGFLQFNLFVGGTPILALLNPLFWALTVLWFLGKFDVIQSLFPAPVYYAGLFCWGVGNLSVLYITVLAARRSERPSLVLAALAVPVYWVMMSLSAIKAAIQLVSAPTFWEKTTHGLDRSAKPAPSRPTVGDGSDAVAVTAAAEERVAGLEPPEGGWAPALDVAEARATTTSSHLVRAATGLRITGIVIMGLVVWLLAGTALVAANGAGGREARAVARAESVPATVAPGTPVGRLVLDGGGFAVTVIQGGGAAALDRGAGHLPASVLLGGKGNAVVVGHRRLAGAPMSGLGGLEQGDELNAETPWGDATYRVTSVKTVSAGSTDLRPTGSPRLTLVTYAGVGRVIQVQADLVGAPLRNLPAPATGYPSLPGIDLAAALATVLWALVAVGAWFAGRLLGRRWGPKVGTLVALPLVVIAVLEAFIAFGHTLPGLL